MSLANGRPFPPELQLAPNLLTLLKALKTDHVPGMGIIILVTICDMLRCLDWFSLMTVLGVAAFYNMFFYCFCCCKLPIAAITEMGSYINQRNKE